MNKQRWKSILLIVIILLLGIFFRFANVQNRAYNADEVRSFYRLSGYTKEEVIDSVFNGEIISADDLQEYQRPSPERGLGDAWRGLRDNPEHPPLYYLAARFWIQIFQAPVSARFLSILISLLVFPGLYWLCWELFGNALTGWMSIALVAVSPYHILISQAAREYSFWTVMTVVASAALLRALRVKDKVSWSLYGITLALGLYSHLLFVIVAFGQLIYVFFVERGRFTKTIKNYWIASLIGGVTFIPWIIVVLTGVDEFEEKTTWVRTYNNNLKIILQYIKVNLGNVFIDFNNSSKIEVYCDYLLLILVVYSLYFLIRNTPPKVWLYIILLVALTSLIQIVPDILWQGRRSLQARYFVPSYLGIELAVAYCLTQFIILVSHQNWRRYLGIFTLFTLLSMGTVSGIFISQTLDWDYLDQGQTASAVNLQLAPIINDAQNPLILSEATHSFILALSYLVDDKVNFQLFKDKDINQWQEKLDLSEAAKKSSDIFLYFPDEEFLEFIDQDQKFTRELVDFPSNLHRKILYKVTQKENINPS